MVLLKWNLTILETFSGKLHAQIEQEVRTDQLIAIATTDL